MKYLKGSMKEGMSIIYDYEIFRRKVGRMKEGMKGW